MANELVRQGSLYGGTKNIVGTKYADLVLETLGKVYIKTGKSSKVLNDVFTLLDKYNTLDVEGIRGKVIITESLESIDYPGEGCLIFDTEKHGLYISYDDRYILILDSLDIPEEGKGYVKRSGDTMTGTLTILSKGAPLIVASKQLVRNLNAEYLNGHPSSYYTVKTLNEKISGEWSFNRKTNFNADTQTKGVATFDNKAVFNDNIVAHSDIITTGSLGTPQFASGFQGYGWRLDSDTNMLTVDYLVVRKAMQVFELIVNQIKATNGSLWVTDSCEVEEVHTIEYLDVNDLTYDKVSPNVWYLPFMGHGVQCFNTKVHNIAKSHLAPASGNLDRVSDTTFYDYNYIIKFKSIPSNISELDFNTINTWDEEVLNLVQIVHFFPESIQGEYETSTEELNNNSIFNENTTPRFLSTQQKWSFLDKDLTIQELYLYYKYFGLKSEIYQETNETTGQLETILPKQMRSTYVVKMNDDHYPTFWEQDLIRCQKFEDNNIKYYDAIVAAKFDTYYYLIIVAESVFDKATIIEYDSEGNLTKFEETYNTTQYEKTSQIDDETLTEYEKQELAEEQRASGTEEIKSNPEVVLTTISPKDGLVRVGNLTNVDRQNSVFITSSEMDSPYVQTMSGINRPDYSVLYSSPKFLTRKYQNKDYYYKEVENNQGEGLFVFDWVVDNDNGVVVPIRTQDGQPLTDEWDNYTIDLENLYRKVWYQLLESPTADCEIEKNASGAYVSTYNVNVRARFGKLDGIYNELFGDVQPHGYGLYGDNVYLTGEFFLSNGKAVAHIGEEVKLEINDKFGKAGLYIQDINNDGKPDIILSAEQVHILTSGGQKTALFTNGRIEAKLLRVTDLEAASQYYYETTDGKVWYYSNTETIEQALAKNGHIITQCVTDEYGNVITHIDKTQPFVSITSNDGLLEARNAKLYGGMLELESTDKSTLVTVGVPEAEDGSIAYAGMTISKNVGTDEVEWQPVAQYTGSVNNYPINNYKSESVYISVTDPWSDSLTIETVVLGGSQDSTQAANPYHYTAYKSGYMSEEFTVTKNTQISLSVTVGKDTDINMDYIFRQANLFTRIYLQDVSNNRNYYLISFSPYISKNSQGSYYIEYYSGKSFYGSTNIPPGTYKMYVNLTLDAELDQEYVNTLPSRFEMTAFVRGNITLNNINVKVLSNEFMTNYMGNGITMGFNQENYFSSYFYNPDSSNKYQVIDFQSKGAGMKYENGKTFQYFNGYQIKLPIPIYTGTIKVMANRHDSGCQDYSGYYQNCPQYPIVKGYKRWLWEVDNEGIPEGHTRSKLYASGLDNDHAQTHGDFVLDFQGLDAYQNIDFSSDNVIVSLTGCPSFGKSGAQDSHRIYGTLYARSNKQLRIWLSDDATNNDGNCFVVIYYIP